MKKVMAMAAMSCLWSLGCADAQEVNPANNPLIGNWVLTGGKYSCEQTRSFAAHTQSWLIDGKVITAPATYALSGNTMYVQMRPGSGGTVAYIIVSNTEIMDTLGDGACHWKKQEAPLWMRMPPRVFEHREGERTGLENRSSCPRAAAPSANNQVGEAVVGARFHNAEARLSRASISSRRGTT